MDVECAKKDFFDLVEFLKEYKVHELIAFYQEKYQQNDPSFLVRSLTYFFDAELQPDPISLNKISWEEVKETIEKALFQSNF